MRFTSFWKIATVEHTRIAIAASGMSSLPTDSSSKE